jgi:iron complex outermembrane receptor protein
MTRFRHLLVALIAVVISAGQLQAQTGTIRGRILDSATGTAVADVEVTVAGRTVPTDADGRFVLTDVPAGDYTLTATRLGYRSVEQPVTVVVGQTSTIEILMIIAPVGLEGLVAIGYGEEEKRDLTGAVVEVEAEEFNTGRIVTAEELIQAKVAGVQVTANNGGEPGGGISMRIRGATSITATNEPLYVIDGVPVPPGGGLSAGRNALNFLNPDDIESFVVLKDASSTAIYGSQGANGVVLITTKSGRGAASGAQVTFLGNWSGSNVTNGPDILNAEQFRQAVADQAPAVLDVLGDATTDWRDAVEQGGFGQDYSLAVAGATNKMNYRLSLGYLSQQGAVKASKNERLSLNLAYNQLLFDDALRLQANVMGARTEDKFTPGGVLGSADNMAPTEPIEDADSPYGGYFEWDDPLGTNNPVGQLNLILDEGTTYRSLGNVTGQYFLPWVDGLSATTRLSYVVTNSERRTFSPSISKGEAESGNDGTVSRSNPTENNFNFEAFGAWAKNWERSSFDVTGGFAWWQWRSEFPSFFAQQLSSDLLGPNGIPSAQLERTFLTVDEFRLASWYARANYGFKDRYLLTATVRADGSSKFGEDNRWATFPSIAGAWRISEEGFMDGAGWLSDLKLRLSYGTNGNQGFPSYSQYKDYLFGGPLAQAQFGSEFVSTIRPSGVDPNIRWEETQAWNIGIDYGFWNNRLAGSIEFYANNTDDLIFEVPVAAGTNLSNFVTTNIGSMKNKGFELTVNALIAEGAGGGFQYNANFNFAYNQNELTEINPFFAGAQEIPVGLISGGVGSFIQVHTPGEPINSFNVYRHIRDSSGNPIYEDMNGDDVIDEQDLYVDLDENGIINQDDRAPFQDPAPDWIIGHTSNMRWKNFDLSFTLLAQVGNYVYNNNASTGGFYDNLRDSSAPNNLHASVLDNEFQRPQYFSDVYVEDASFLRMNNIQLGYQVTPRLRAYGVVQNAFTITGYSGIDPTAAGINGVDNNIFPQVRTFLAGLNFAI